MIRYKKYQVTGEQSPLKGLWYARPVIEEIFDIKKPAKQMANHNTPYSAGIIKGGAGRYGVSCIQELILDGKNVKLDDLAIFSVGIVSKTGAHCLRHNRHSIGICYEGGLDAQGRPADTRTPEQKASLLALLRELKSCFPRALIVEHHDLNPMKACPCFEAEREYRGI